MIGGQRTAVRDLGLREYGEVWELQKRLVDQRLAGEIPDTLLLVEHPHVVTRGRAYRGRTLPGDPGVPVFDVDRGGDVTYHGPGQLVGYPIVHLKEAGISLEEHLRGMERALIEGVASFGIAATRVEGFTGIWAGAKKLASIGVGVRRWVTFHGFALNVNTDLSYFQRLYPCGLQPSTLTSMQKLLGRPVDMAAVKTLFPRCLAPRLKVPGTNPLA